jgi:hypothetical protein
MVSLIHLRRREQVTDYFYGGRGLEQGHIVFAPFSLAPGSSRVWRDQQNKNRFNGFGPFPSQGVESKPLKRLSDFRRPTPG